MTFICICYKSLEFDNAIAPCMAVAECGRRYFFSLLCCTRDKMMCFVKKEKKAKEETLEKKGNAERALRCGLGESVAHRVVAVGCCLWPKRVSACGHYGGSMG